MRTRTLATIDEGPRLRRRVCVAGRVQGVGFRAWTVRRATGLGLDGRVRNLVDGSVEVEAEGRSEDVFRLIELLRRGPSLAIVREVRDLTAGSDPLPSPFRATY